jgi:hypothetical protein
MATTFSHGQILLNATMLKVIGFRIEVGLCRIGYTEAPPLDFFKVFSSGVGHKFVEFLLCHLRFLEIEDATPPRSGAAS